MAHSFGRTLIYKGVFPCSAKRMRHGSFFFSVSWFNKGLIHDVMTIQFNTAVMYTNTPNTIHLLTGVQPPILHNIVGNTLLSIQSKNTSRNIDMTLTCNAHNKTPRKILILKTEV